MAKRKAKYNSKPVETEFEMKNASEQQATKLAAVIVEHNGLFTSGASEDVQWAIQNGASAVGLFLTALENRTKEVVKKVKRVLTPFLTIHTEPTTKEVLVADIVANKNENNVADEISDYAKSMMEDPKFIISTAVGDVSFVALTVGADLGFTKNPQTADFMTDEFCRKWSAENLDGQAIEPCLPDDGPRIRKAWLNQPKGTVVWCAMERLSVSGVYPIVWIVGRRSDGRRWLCGRWADADRQWGLGGVIVFRLRKITQD